MGRPTDWLLATAAGAVLAVMIQLNSLLAAHSSALFASWVAHGVGAAMALCLAAAASRLARFAGPRDVGDTQEPLPRLPTPFWAYLGGIPGAFTVVLAAIAVNGGLTLSATLALMLVGQTAFGMAADRFGWFGLARRPLGARELVGALALLAGSAFLHLGGRAP
ncbi:DMT family transporter [Mesorhizobium sp. L-8-3]|uniref:DMT family transporter n=1 Tax=Mesorhizobium sp. L-8-3 TaxID=2744522 RepID=UPI001929302C|nr:DMT family transporter [Mesorhizobium sp. L-8-3]BCH22280.1 membrane protein [Mesorhizobium sp. L-8-3]